MAWLSGIILSFIIVLLALPAWADVGASPWVGDQAGEARLISSVSATGKLTTLNLGVEFRLKDGWKIYWRTPGDAGYPPEMNWSGSENLKETEILWPAPERFVLENLQNYGYGGHVILPVLAHLDTATAPVSLRLDMEYLACKEICVPMSAGLALDIPSGLAHLTVFAHPIEQFISQVPNDNPARGLVIEKAEVVGDNQAIRVTLRGDQPLVAPDIFIEPDTVALFGFPDVKLMGNRAVLEVLVIETTLKRDLTAGLLTFTATDGERNFTTSLVPTQIKLPETPQIKWFLMLGLAVLGGFILNLMPCVLPVLSLKIVGVAHYGGAEKGHIRAAFLASAMGIMVSFWVLASVAIGLKSVGAAVGWGIQFQNPWFLGFMVVILTLFAVNLWGLFEINLPSWMLRPATSNRIKHHTMGGHFLSGVFATLLATPCSAPFLGTAVGFALSRGALEILAIFTALGVGMALPYFLVALYPQSAQSLPKPGAWMVTLKKILAVALLATVVWLGSVLVTVLSDSDVETENQESGEVLKWNRFDVALIPSLVDQGKIVFVDITADWCITCKINKIAVLDRPAMEEVLGGEDIILMQADWTRPDPNISHYMAQFERYGIPFNAVYGPLLPDGRLLPELLTESAVIDAIKAAK